MLKSKFPSEQAANDYKRLHQLHQRVAMPLAGTGQWALVFPLNAHVTVRDGAPASMRLSK